jgi:hypothetical protein
MVLTADLIALDEATAFEAVECLAHRGFPNRL